MKRRGLSSSSSAHTAAGKAAYERIAAATDRVVQLTRSGDCKAALAAYGTLERLHGEAFAHAESGGRTPNPIGHSLRAEAVLIRACIVRPQKFARGTEPPADKRRQTMPMPAVELRGRQRRKRPR
jgi:hypothetical protein